MGIRVDYTPVGPTIVAAYATGLGADADKKRREMLTAQMAHNRLTAQMFMNREEMANRNKNWEANRNLQLQLFEAAERRRVEEAEKARAARRGEEVRGIVAEGVLSDEEAAFKGIGLGSHLPLTPEQERQRGELESNINSIRTTGMAMIRNPDGSIGRVPVPADQRDLTIQRMDEIRRSILPQRNPAGAPATPKDVFSRSSFTMEEYPGVIFHTDPLTGKTSVLEPGATAAKMESATAKWEEAAKTKELDAKNKLAAELQKQAAEEVTLSKGSLDFDKALTKVIEQRNAVNKRMGLPMIELPAAEGEQKQPAPATGAQPTMAPAVTPPTGAPILNPEAAAQIWGANKPMPAAAAVVAPPPAATAPQGVAQSPFAPPTVPQAMATEAAMTIPGIPQLTAGKEGEAIYAEMKPGTIYIGPDGKLRRKQ